MAYAVTSDIRLMTNLTTSDISDADITSLITEASTQVNSDVNMKVIREPVYPIDNTRENKIDGANTVYYTRHWYGKFLADLNNDGIVDTADITVTQVDTDGTESTLSVSAIDDSLSKITLSAAPSSGVRLFLTYSYSYVREVDGSVDPKLKLATTFLTSAFCYAKINIGKAPNIQFGSTKLTRHMKSFQEYYNRYLEVIKQIQSLGGLVQSGENVWTF